MQVFDTQRIQNSLDWRELIDAIRESLRAGKVQSPARQVLDIELPNGGQAQLLIMPAWVGGESIGVKVVTFFPDNAERDQATVNAGYMLFDGNDGRLESVFDADILTVRRTAAASALAAQMLVKEGAQRYLIIGTGQLSAAVVQAHCAVRQYRVVEVFGRRPDKAEEIVKALHGAGIAASVSLDRDESLARADVISTVTSSTTAIVRGELLRPGAHLDLIGAFSPKMRESDDEAIRRASLFVDSRAGALQAGDLAQPIEAKVVSAIDIQADLRELVAGEHPGRRNADEITLFKSAGIALFDLAAAQLASQSSEKSSD